MLKGPMPSDADRTRIDDALRSDHQASRSSFGSCTFIHGPKSPRKAAAITLGVSCRQAALCCPCRCSQEQHQDADASVPATLGNIRAAGKSKRAPLQQARKLQASARSNCRCLDVKQPQHTALLHTHTQKAASSLYPLPPSFHPMYAPILPPPRSGLHNVRTPPRLPCAPCPFVTSRLDAWSGCDDAVRA